MSQSLVRLLTNASSSLKLDEPTLPDESNMNTMSALVPQAAGTEIYGIDEREKGWGRGGGS